jgi:hypothetical protein
MAQRKAKEPLLAEVPRPRLSDEELMELFYSGQRKEKECQNDENDISVHVAVSAESASDKVLHKDEIEEPFPTGRFLRRTFL